MSMKVEMESWELSNLQQHMANLVRYYESDIRFLGRLGECSKGSTQRYAQELMRDRLERLENADYLWEVLIQQ